MSRDTFWNFTPREISLQRLQLERVQISYTCVLSSQVYEPGAVKQPGPGVAAASPAAVLLQAAAAAAAASSSVAAAGHYVTVVSRSQWRI